MTGGYDIKLVNGIPDQFKCPTCEKLMREPVQTANGERECKSCFESKPRTVISSYFLDKHARREISQLPCKCDFEPQCPWVGTVAQVEPHLQTCEYVVAQCRHCGEMFPKKDITHHEQMTCPERVLQCKFCLEEMPSSAYEGHKITCKEMREDCPFNCGKRLLTHEIRQHIENCENLLNGVECPFRIIGCNYKGSQTSSRKDLENHLREDFMTHALDCFSKIHELKVLGKSMDEEKNEMLRFQELQNRCQNLQTENDKLIKEVGLLKEKQNEHQQRISELEVKLSSIDGLDLEKRLKKSLGEINELQKLLDSFTGQDLHADLIELRKYSSSLNMNYEQLNSLEKENALIQVKLSDIELKTQLLESMVHTGHQMWRLDRVANRMADATKGKLNALHSPPAYTKRGGYKFCTRLYLYGDGLGKGTHLSLFFVLMKSEYDNLCKWPFQQRVTFRIINPKHPDRNHEESFIPDKKSSSFQKPTKDMNIAAGCPTFIRLDTVRDQNFIIDDCLYFEVFVGAENSHVT